MFKKNSQYAHHYKYLGKSGQRATKFAVCNIQDKVNAGELVADIAATMPVTAPMSGYYELRAPGADIIRTMVPSTRAAADYVPICIFEAIHRLDDGRTLVIRKGAFVDRLAPDAKYNVSLLTACNYPDRVFLVDGQRLHDGARIASSAPGWHVYKSFMIAPVDFWQTVAHRLIKLNNRLT